MKDKVKGIRITSLTVKIIFIFTLFLLTSNLASHYISLMLNRSAMIGMIQKLMIKDLKDQYRFANSQHQIFQFKKDLQGSLGNIEKKALTDFSNKKSILLGVKSDGEILFQGSLFEKSKYLRDKKTLSILNENKKKGILEGIISIHFNNEEYTTVYKYNRSWDVFMIRGEEINEFNKESLAVFIQVIGYIVVITFLCVIVGIFLIRYILRFVKVISTAILNMIQSQKLERIDLEKASGDEITFLGVAFNSLSHTIGTLLNIFRKFTNKNIVIKAYKERTIELEGHRMELTCLFSDIKSFTYMTEVLGTDIITLLNMHYHKAIKAILDEEGIIGSIIGDALLAVYGVLGEDEAEDKSFQAVKSAYKIHVVTAEIRKRMSEIRDNIIKEKGFLTEKEEKVYKAVLIQVGVGIDGGTVFYGNIGSKDRMTNTVIGDNVNSSSRLEGLTRIYKVPVICSDYVKDDIESNVLNHGLRFIELDTVQVKGKTIGKKVYWVLFEKDLNEKLENDIKFFSEALPMYYSGDWKKAKSLFQKCDFELADVFKERTESEEAPSDWNGIWAMTSK